LAEAAEKKAGAFHWGNGRSFFAQARRFLEKKKYIGNHFILFYIFLIAMGKKSE